MDDTTFSSTLNPPVGSVNSLIGPSTPAPTPAPASAPPPAPQARNAVGLQYQPNMNGVMAAGQNYAQTQSAQDLAGAEAMAQAAEQQSAADHAAVAKARSETKPIPAFVPTKETASDLSMIFGMLGVLGTALGGKAKTAGMEGMAAMTGMMQGYQQGRQDLYEKEYKQFQTSLETMKAHNAEIQQELQYALKLSATDMEKGKTYAQLAMARLGAPVLQAKLQYEGALKTAEHQHQIGLELLRMTKAAALQQANNAREQTRPIQQTVNGKQVTLLLHTAPNGSARLTYMDGTPVDESTAASLLSPQRPASRQQNVSDDSLDQTAAGIASGAFRPPATTNPFRNEIMNRVLEMNPIYKESDFGNRAMAERHWIDPNGQGGKQLMAFNTVAQHITTYEELAKALDNSDIQAQNRLLNYVNVQMGHPEVTNLNAARQAISAEIVKAITGVAGARADRSEAEGTLSSALSPAQMEGAVQTIRHLIGGRFESSLALYKAGTGKTEEHFFKFLTPEALSVFRPQSTGAPSAARPAAPGNKTPAITPELLEKAKKALEWANANPNDPDADTVRKSANRVLGGG